MQPKQIRTVWHYQYMSWPDHGVPQEPGGVLSFLTQVNAKQSEFPDAGPMIIHCRYHCSSYLPKVVVFMDTSKVSARADFQECIAVHTLL